MRHPNVDACISDNLGGNTLDIMITTSLMIILAAVMTLINEGLSMMQITEDVDLWSFIVWSVFIGLLFVIINRIMKAVND